jgi:hypothetical protein
VPSTTKSPTIILNPPEEKRSYTSYYIDDINFRSGQNNIEVKATDFNGNESVKYFTFNVNRIK